MAGLGSLGDPTRRAIFELLARRPSWSVSWHGMIVSGGGWTAILELFATAVQ